MWCFSRAVPRHLLAVVGAMVLLMALAPHTDAAAGDLDPSFVGGRVTTDFTRHADIPWSMAVKSDGRIVAAGESGCCSNPKFALARYLAA